jgi:ATP-dependent Clp protease ATP-binding subunit ClpX
VQPEDLIKYGLIPEFVGRLPVLTTLDDLDRAALIEILTRPRNAITKQYEKLFELENVNLRFTGEVLGAIADLAMRRKSGARGLRAILEGIMLDVMYDLPSCTDVEECLISEDVVTKGAKPLLVYSKQKESA